jgi:5'-deoxynucleotidase
MENSFFSLIFRQKYIKRWGLMRSEHEETLAEHSSEVAIISHALASISNEVYGKNIDIGKVVTLALFHDVTEVYTGDLPTPIKYYSPAMRSIYAKIESEAVENLIDHLPGELKSTYRPIIDPKDEPLYKYVKAADKICAYIKCVEEEKGGNLEFSSAKIATLDQINALEMPEVSYFMEKLLPPFFLSLDDMQK